ncbi:unnamed protein product [Penicillium roqueforti FM164]|uniref:Genomic scaffold, ProqFM164S02 n=1 Tax=Penicillium roqueforti (strain FM164) TaxID=1365484 RepID=W6Q847_PENRF|nr:unnamed protein product [Penicillium roqueforti FM164]
MPRKSTTFLRRDYYDRPKVIPDGMRNMAMVGSSSLFLVKCLLVWTIACVGQTIDHPMGLG